MSSANLKKLFILLTTFLGVLILAAPQSAKAQEPVELNVTVSDWTTPDFRDFVKQVYEEENPHVTLNWQGMAFRPLFESLEIQLGAQSPTLDVYGVDVPLVASYGIRDYLQPLDEYFTEEEQAGWLPEAREAGSYEGELVAAPGRTSTQMLYYNKDMFEEVGIEPPPTDPAERWTWEQVVDAAQKLTRDTDGDGQIDTWGLLFHQVSRPYQMLALPQSAGGGSGISDDGMSVQGQLTNEGWLRAAQFYYDLFNTWEVSPIGVTPEETQDYFRAGRVGMIVTGDWGLSLFQDADFDWGVAPHPYFEGGEPVTPTGSWHWGVSPFSENKEEAAKLVNFVTTDERALTFLFEETSRLAAHEIIFDFTPEQIEAAGYPLEGYELIQYELANTAQHRPKSPGYLEWESILSATFEDIRNGADPETALRQAESRIQGQLQKYSR